LAGELTEQLMEFVVDRAVGVGAVVRSAPVAELGQDPRLDQPRRTQIGCKQVRPSCDKSTSRSTQRLSSERRRNISVPAPSRIPRAVPPLRGLLGRHPVVPGLTPRPTMYRRFAAGGKARSFRQDLRDERDGGNPASCLPAIAPAANFAEAATSPKTAVASAVKPVIHHEGHEVHEGLSWQAAASAFGVRRHDAAFRGTGVPPVIPTGRTGVRPVHPVHPVKKRLPLRYQGPEGRPILARPVRAGNPSAASAKPRRVGTWMWRWSRLRRRRLRRGTSGCSKTLWFCEYRGREEKCLRDASEAPLLA
jgi:hypothetical protein